MAGPCLGELGGEVGRPLQRRSALRYGSDDHMTVEQLLTAILRVLHHIDRMMMASMEARGPMPDDLPAPGPDEGPPE